MGTPPDPGQPPQAKPRSTRRAFLADAWRWAGAALALGGAVLVHRVLGGAAPAPETVTLSAAQLKRLEAEGRLELPGYFVFGSLANPRALRMRCTHLGCSLSYDAAARRFDCPCHGSRFDERGAVLAGPAERPLVEVAVKGRVP
jgi:nitrite reductase/ring-hydroxylating ferredoxin subunit